MARSTLGAARIELSINSAQFIDQMKRMEAAVGKFQRSMVNVQRKFERTGRKLERVGGNLMRKFTLPVTGVGVAAAKSAIDFESAFAGVRKTIDATESEFSRLRQGILDMSKQLPTSANEIAGVAEAAGQLGIRTDAILEFSKTMVMLGDTTNLTADQAATSLARIANVMQIPQDKFDEMGSTIVDLGNNFATTEAEITEFAQRIAGAGQVAGLAYPDIFAIGAAMSSVGVRAEAGGTAVQKALLAINDAVATGSGRLSTFASTAGMSAQEFQQAWREDAGQAFAGFVSGLGAAGDNATTILSEAGLSSERTRAAFLSLANAGDLINQTLGTASAAWAENTALTDEARQRYETIASKLQVLKNNVVAVGITIGDALLPYIEKAINFLQDLTAAFDSLSSEAKTRILAVAGTLAASGPLVMALGVTSKAIGSLFVPIRGLAKLMAWLGKGVVSTILVGSFNKYAAAIRLVRRKGMIPLGRTIMKAAGAFALMALKVAAAVAVVGGIILVAKSVYDAWDSVKHYFADLWDRIVIMFADGVESLAGLMSGLSSVIPGISAPLEGLKVTMQNMRKEANERIEARGAITFGEVVGDVGDKIMDNVGKTVDAVKSGYSSITGYVSGLLPSFDAFGELAGAMDKARNARQASGLAVGLDNMTLGTTATAHIDTGGLEKYKVAAEDARSATEIATGGIRTKWTQVSDDLANNLVPMIASGLADMSASFIENVAQISVAGGSLQDVFNQVLGALADLAVRVGKIALATGIAIEGIKKALQSLNPAAAIAAGIALIAVGSAVKAALAKSAEKASASGSEGNIPRMAAGGVVPPGFPNDTYPALLTSGERVIPDPLPLPKSGGMGGGRQVIENHLYIDGREVEISLEERKYRRGR